MPTIGHLSSLEIKLNNEVNEVVTFNSGNVASRGGNTKLSETETAKSVKEDATPNKSESTLVNFTASTALAIAMLLFFLNVIYHQWRRATQSQFVKAKLWTLTRKCILTYYLRQ